MAELQTQGLGIRIGDVQVCRDLDLHVREGESWCILGRNGTGKTTLLHTLAGLRTADAGDLTLNGRSLAAAPRREVARKARRSGIGPRTFNNAGERDSTDPAPRG